MREIKDQTDGRTYDRQASFQFIQPTEKSVHTTREDNIFPRRIYEIQEAVTCSSTQMEIDGNKPAPKTRYRETSDFFYSQPVSFTDKNVNYDSL